MFLRPILIDKHWLDMYYCWEIGLRIRHPSWR